MPIAPTLRQLDDQAFWDHTFSIALTRLFRSKFYRGEAGGGRFPEDLVEDAAVVASVALTIRTRDRQQRDADATPPPPVTHVEGTTRITSYPPQQLAAPTQEHDTECDCRRCLDAEVIANRDATIQDLRKSLRKCYDEREHIKTLWKERFGSDDPALTRDGNDMWMPAARATKP